MKVKHSSGWFAAGPEGGRALELLSDGAFRLYFCLCLRANRDNGRQTANYRDLASALHRSRRSIITYFDELQHQEVCRLDPAVNQHQGGEIEICDSFWPYEKAVTPATLPDAAHYVGQVRALLADRPCVKTAFTPAERKLAEAWFATKVSLEQIERGILLGCARKYVTMLNRQESGVISSLSYFRDLIDEAGQPETPAGYWDYLKFQLKRLEAQWLAKQSRAAGANFARATGKETQKRRNDDDSHS